MKPNVIMKYTAASDAAETSGTSFCVIDYNHLWDLCLGQFKIYR